MKKRDSSLAGYIAVLSSLLCTVPLVAQNGNVGIGTDSPDTTLHIAGKVKIDDGSQQDGRILTTDSTGLATWQRLSSGALLPALPAFRGELCMRITGALPVDPNPNAVAVAGNYAYVVDRTTDDLKVIDITVPADPVLVGSVGIGSTPLRMRVSGSYAHVIDLDSRDLKIVDVSDPTNPSVSGSVGFNFSPAALDVQGNYAYVAGNAISDDTLKAVDVSNPSSPVIVGSIVIGSEVQGVSVSGNYAYVIDSDTDDLRVIDITNPASPSQTGSLPLGSHPTAVVVQGNFAYVLDSDTDDLKVIDVSNPANPAMMGSVDVGPLQSGALQVQGDYACVVDPFSEKLEVVDVGEPANPSLLGSIALDATPLSVDMQHNFAYVVDHGSQDLKVIQLFCIPTVSVDPLSGEIFESPAVSWERKDGNLYNLNPANVGIGTPAPGATLHVAGNVKIEDGSQSDGYVLTSDSMGLASWQRLKAQNLLGTSTQETLCLYIAGDALTGPHPASVHVEGDYSYIVDGVDDSLSVIDISQPHDPAITARVKVGGAPQSVYAESNYAYTVSLSGGFEVIDVSDPANPAIIGTLSLGFLPLPNAVFVKGNYAYVVDESSDDLKVIDVSNPANPLLSGDTGTGATPQSVYVQGDYAYVVDSGSDDLKVFDVSNPASPAAVGSVVLGAEPYYVFVQDDYAYVVDRTSDDLKVIDVSNPASPSVTGSVMLGALPNEVHVRGNFAYVVDGGSDDLKVIDISNPATPVITGSLGLGPNPVSIYVQGNYASVVDVSTEDIKVIGLSCAPNVSIDPVTGNFTEGQPDTWKWNGHDISNINPGYVGIGTASPNENLVVGQDFGSDLSGTRLTIGDTGNNSGLNIGEDIDNRAWLLWEATDNRASMGIRDGGSVSTLITMRNGMVGINNIDPQVMMHVSGGDQVIDRGTVTSGLERFLTIGGARFAAGNPFAALKFQNNDEDTGSGDYIGASITSENSSGIGSGDLRFSTTYAYGVDPIQRMIIDKDGRVGMGISNPETNLHVAGGNWDVGSTEGDFKIGTSTHRLAIGVAVDGGGAGDARIFAKGGTNKLILGAGTTSVMSVRANGRVGIGVTSPAEAFHISGGNQLIDRGSTSNGLTRSLTIGGARSASGSAFAQLNFQNIDDNSDGNGGNNTDYTGARISSENNGQDDDGDLRFYTTNNSTLTQRMIIDENGNVGINTGAPSQRLEVNGSVYAVGGDVFTAANNGVINAGGGIMNVNVNVIADGTPALAHVGGDEDLYISDDLEVGSDAYKPGGGSWTAISDARLKKDISPFTDGLAQVLQINPVRYRYKEELALYDPNREHIGVLAQEIEEVAPYTVELCPFGQIVKEDEQGNEVIVEPGTLYYTFDGSALQYMLINAIKEQQEIIQGQQAELAELKGLREDFEHLKKENAQLKQMEMRLVVLEAAMNSR